MPNINRVRCAWTNFPGAPGLSTFYLADGSTDVTAIKTFFNAFKDDLPQGTVVTIPQAGDQIDVGTGKIVGSWSGTGGGTALSVPAASAFSGSSGAMVRWQTGSVINGHRLSGRTYVVPIRGSDYDTNGSLSSAFTTTLQNAANALLGTLGANFLVYHRPQNTTPSNPGSPGSVAAVTSALVPDLAVVMRSRRI
jgi:hypothetical protein